MEAEANRQRWLVCSFLTLLILTWHTAWADQTFGTLRVRILEPSTGKVGVDVSSDDEPWRRWSSEVDGTGIVTVRGLPPSTYRVTARFPNGTNAVLSIDMAASEVVSLEASPDSPAGGGPSLRVVDRDRLGRATSLGLQQLRDLPAAKTFSGLLDTSAPSVMTDRIEGGGVAAATPVRAGARAGSWTDLSTFFGGLNAGL